MSFGTEEALPTTSGARGDAVVLWNFPVKGRQDVVDFLEKFRCEVRLGIPYDERHRKYSTEELKEAARGAHGIMVSGRDDVTREVLEACEDLIVVSKRGIGTDKIDVDAATELGIMVTNTPVPGHRTAVAEYGVALYISLVKKVVTGDRVLRSGGFDHLEQSLFSGKTAGIIGYGHVGRQSAKIYKGLGLEVLSYDPFGAPDETSVELDELLRRADVVTLHCNLTDDNHHMIDRDAIAKMKPRAVVVNSARGGLINESDLAAAIREGRLGGAALNVFEEEPPPPDSPMLADDIADRVIVTPHGAGGHVTEVFEQMPMALAEYHVTALRGEEPTSDIVSPIINPQVLPHWRGRDKAPLARS